MAIMTRAPTQRPEKRRLLPTPAVEQPSYEQCCKRSSQSRQLRRANFGVRYVVSAKEPNGSTGAARAALELDPLGYPPSQPDLRRGICDARTHRCLRMNGHYKSLANAGRVYRHVILSEHVTAAVSKRSSLSALKSWIDHDFCVFTE